MATAAVWKRTAAEVVASVQVHGNSRINRLLVALAAETTLARRTADLDAVERSPSRMGYRAASDALHATKPLHEAAWDRLTEADLLAWQTAVGQLELAAEADVA